jgi:spermidine synthase
VLSADYVGALLASVSFPFLILPLLGLVRAALAFGMLNVLIGTFGTSMFWHELSGRRSLAAWNVVAWCLLLAGLISAGSATSWLEDRLYQDEIILAETTPYQRIVVTRWRDDYRLHLNGHLQFSSTDEYRYHEALVLPSLSTAASLVRRPEGLRVLILGGGDGLAARQALSAARIDRIDLVDIDRRVVELFRDQAHLNRLNAGALSDPRLIAHFQDAMVFLREGSSQYDVIIMDLPDPASVATNKLYTTAFFGLALRRLSHQGVLVTQASSPFYARRTFWCIHHTLHEALSHLPGRGGEVIPYHAYVPSFGDWGFVMVVPDTLSQSVGLAIPGRFLTEKVFAQARVFAPDVQQVPTDINRLDTPVLLRYHSQDWSRWGE